MAAMDPMFLPPDLPVPEDDGAARHLPGTAVPGVALAATTGGEVAPAGLDGWSVVFAYPRTGKPGSELPSGVTFGWPVWNHGP